MKKLFIAVLAFLITQSCYSADMHVKTGFGYMKDKSGNAVCKVRLTPGIYASPSNGLTYVEVPNEAALNNIEIYYEPASESDIAAKKAAVRKQVLDALDLTEEDLAKLKALI